jgi:phosphatidylserine synthase
LAAPLALASLFILWVIATATPWPVLRDDLLLGAVAALYFARVHLGASLGWRLLTQPHKEALVGTIFALAVAVPSLALADHPARLVSAIFAFAALCVLNCLMIENAENGKSPSADTRALLALTVLGLVAALLPSLSETRALLIATSLSAFLLTALTRESRRLSPLAFRVAADAVLLTPLLVLPWLRR